MLDDLQAVIEQLQNMIKPHDDYLSGKETRTRQVLIDPLLKALGWDVSDPCVVYLEHNWMDYALMSDDQPVAVIEAKPLPKPLGKSLERKVITQAITYAVENNIPYIIVANGDRWEMYEVLKPGTLKEKRLMMFELSQQPAHEIALQVLRIWKPNLASGKPKRAMKPVLDAATDNDDNDGIDKKISTFDDGKTFKEIDGDWTGKEICAFRFEGKTYKEVKDWADFYFRFFEILSKDDTLQIRDVLELKPPNFKDNRSSFPTWTTSGSIKEIGKTGVYVHTGISNKDKQKVIKDVVKHFRCDMPVPLEEAG